MRKYFKKAAAASAALEGGNKKDKPAIEGEKASEEDVAEDLAKLSLKGKEEGGAAAEINGTEA